MTRVSRAQAPAAKPVTVPEEGGIALRPVYSATVVIAARGAITEERRNWIRDSLAEDGLRVVFVKHADAIADLPPDPVLRGELAAIAVELNGRARRLSEPHAEAWPAGDRVQVVLLREIAAKILAAIGGAR